MSDLQPQEAAPAPVEQQSTEPAQQPEAANPETLQQQPGTEPPPEPVKDEGKAAREAMQRRINRLTYDKARERIARETLEQELQQFRLQQQTHDPQSQQQQPQQPQYSRELIQQEAQRLNAEQKFVEQCNALVSKGRAESKDFDTKLTSLAGITGPLLNDQGRPEPILEALLSTDAPYKVIAHLADHPDIAADLVELTPIQQARKLALIEHQMNAKPIRQPSSAPKPLEPVTASAASAEPDPADTERWIAWRNKAAKR